MAKHKIGDKFIKIKHHEDDTDESIIKDGGVPLGFVTTILEINTSGGYRMIHPDGHHDWNTVDRVLDGYYQKLEEIINWEEVFKNG